MEDEVRPMDTDEESQHLSSWQIAQKIIFEVSYFTKEANEELKLLDIELDHLHEEREQHRSIFLLENSQKHLYKSSYVKGFQERLATAQAQKKEILNTLITNLKDKQIIIITELAQRSRYRRAGLLARGKRVGRRGHVQEQPLCRQRHNGRRRRRGVRLRLSLQLDPELGGLVAEDEAIVLDACHVLSATIAWPVGE